MKVVPWVVGNWKMNPPQAQIVQWIEQLNSELKQDLINEQECILGVAPTALALQSMQSQTYDRPILTVAQDVSQFDGTGAYTGEISAHLLKDSHINNVIIGHSERRTYFNEDGTILCKKIQNALQNGLTVIYCVGETLQEREQGIAEQVILQQICDVASVIEQAQWQHIVIAYEPVWAIGTGKTASVEDAQSMHQHIRTAVRQITTAADTMPILYGGSVKPENAEQFAACPDINGALVGGASLNAGSFYQIAKAFAKVKV